MPKAPEPSSTCQNTTKSLPRISPKSYCYNAVPNRFSSRFSTSRTNGPRLLSLPKAGTHSPFREKSHTRAHTPKQGCFGWGWYHYSRSVPHVHQHPRAGCQNGKLCRFWVLAGCTLEGRRKPSGQRCAYARRCSEGVAALLGRVIFLLLSKLRLVCPVPDTSFGSPDAPACAVPVQAASQLGSFRLGVQWFSVETGRIFCYNFGKRVT